MADKWRMPLRIRSIAASLSLIIGETAVMTFRGTYCAPTAHLVRYSVQVHKTSQRVHIAYLGRILSPCLSTLATIDTLGL